MQPIANCQEEFLRHVKFAGIVTLMRSVPLATRLRVAAGDVPQKVIVANSGIGSDQISKIWSGETKDPRWSTMVAILRDGLRVSLDAFASGGEVRTPVGLEDVRPEYREHLANLEALSPRDRRTVLDLVESFAAAVTNTGQSTKVRRPVTRPPKKPETSDDTRPTDERNRPIGSR
jgi:transcriptional regulator with XRE-family HTH domain